jgi:endonuclease/exonuclease/phosphatase family metal-dependent hydrolase
LARSVDVLTDDEMKLVAYNLRLGLALHQRVNFGRIAETMRDADIVGLQTADASRPAARIPPKRGCEWKRLDRQ